MFQYVSYTEYGTTDGRFQRSQETKLVNVADIESKKMPQRRVQDAPDIARWKMLCRRSNKGRRT